MTMKRADRVSDLIKAELSDILLREVRDPRIGSITITDVKLTDDLKSAKIYFVRMGDDSRRSEAEEGLQKAAGFLRRELGRRIQLRFVPSISFIYDRSFEYGDRIDKLLSDVRREDSE
ncbi:MAG TPA: 30S ribosome-binding factor RbfA [Syntrophales bacterium]|nr:30S ribosome-binding factor RbfA [Syntrophales bacterium]